MYLLQLLSLTPQSIVEYSEYTYYLRLSSTPTGMLTLTLDATSGTLFAFNLPMIVFRSDNWSKPQKLVVLINESVQSGESQKLALGDEDCLLSEPSVMITIINGGLHFCLRMFLEAPLQ